MLVSTMLLHETGQMQRNWKKIWIVEREAIKGGKKHFNKGETRLQSEKVAVEMEEKIYRLGIWM